VLKVGLLSNTAVYAGIGAIVLLQALFVYWTPMNRLFDSIPLTAGGWAKATAVALVGGLLVSLEKLLWRKFRQRRPPAIYPEHSTVVEGPRPMQRAA